MFTNDRNLKITKLKQIADYVRTTALGSILYVSNGHIGGNTSAVELLVVLYFGGQFCFDPNDPKNKNRDRVLILGHKGPLRYTIFSLLGYIKEEELNTYRTFGSRLQGHEDMYTTPGVDITPSGSLGMLLSYGVGSAIANRQKGLRARTLVFLGDGEEQEGNVSEAARHATTLGLNNLICILDKKNGKQLSRATVQSDGHDVKTIWQGYGWNVLEITNGNDMEEVLSVYEQLSDIIKPTMIIANTLKGCGVKGAEDHFNGYHTLSAVHDKAVIVNSYNEMREKLSSSSLTPEKVSKIALSMLRRPNDAPKADKPIDPSIYDIRTHTGVNVDKALFDYLGEVKRRTCTDGTPINIHFITPDLLLESEVAEYGLRNYLHFIDSGIREQHAIAMAHGLSIENPDARICLFFGDVFSYRAMDQINAAATGKSNLLILGTYSGLSHALNGRTHQSVGQPGAIMSIPEIDFYEPADSFDLFNVLSHTLVKNAGVSYVRLHRDTVTVERDDADKDNIIAYFAHRSKNEPKLLLISSGFTVGSSVEAAKVLEKQHNIPANVINVVNHKKFAECAPQLIINACPILTVYNGHPRILSQVVSEAILSNPCIPRPKSLMAHGFESGTTGSYKELLRHYKLDSVGIASIAKNML
jgi:transketolase